VSYRIERRRDANLQRSFPRCLVMCDATTVSRRSGFTLLELIVVIAIIATIAAVVAPSVFRNVGDAKVSAVRSQIETFKISLSTYRIDNDAYPTTAQGLAALRERPAAPPSPRQWRGPYLDGILPLDPWGFPYHYVAPGRHNPTGYDLFSLGRDGQLGGEGEDGDITSWGGPVGAQTP
jgi:general secretion pathway protein G